MASTSESVRARLLQGWIAQPKLDGHRLQLHVGPNGQLISYTRQGTIHTAPLSPELRSAFKDFVSDSGWVTFEGEWLKPQNRVHLFDVLQYESTKLTLHSYEERYRILKNLYRISPYIKLVPVLRKHDQCMQILQSADPEVEGLVFKAWTTKGWDDTGIVRCLKQGLRQIRV